MRTIAVIAVASALTLAGCAASVSPPPDVASLPPPDAPKVLDFEAAAYAIEGTTKSGTPTRDGIVAADPKVLPLGTKIRVSGAGSYDGVYEVTDTGRTIRGNEIDIYIRDGKEATRFGRKNVKVEVLD